MRTIHVLCGASAALLLAVGIAPGCGGSGGTGGSATNGAGGANGGGSPSTGHTMGTSTNGTGGTTPGSGGSTPGTGGTSPGTGGTTPGSGGSGGTPVVCSGSTPVALTVHDTMGWCTIGVDADTAVSVDQTVCVGASEVVNLSAIPLVVGGATSFEVGKWHHTDGDTGTGDPGTVTGTGVNEKTVTTVTVPATGKKCVWICCPFIGGTDCTTMDQCL